MDEEKAISFLTEVEKYFQMKSLMSDEDYTIQAYTNNAFLISKVIAFIKQKGAAE